MWTSNASQPSKAWPGKALGPRGRGKKLQYSSYIKQKLYSINHIIRYNSYIVTQITILQYYNIRLYKQFITQHCNNIVTQITHSCNYIVMHITQYCNNIVISITQYCNYIVMHITLYFSYIVMHITLYCNYINCIL
jgi:hypothetical protein